MSQPYGQDPYGYRPQQPTYPPQQGYGYPPGPPPRKKSSAPLILLIIGVVLVFVFGGCAVLIAAATGGGSSAPTTVVADREPADEDQASEPESDAAEAEAKPEAKPKTAGIGSRVRDGKFEFTVTRLEKRDRVGGEFLSKDAQGVFLLVHVKVTNIGDESESFMGAEQKLFDAKGREFEASSEAAFYLDDSKSLYEKINPGNSVDGVVLFDIPKNVEPVSIELHDSIFSDGVRVSLAGS